MDLVQVKEEIFKGSQRIITETEEMKNLAMVAAEKERDYRVALSAELLKLKGQEVQMSIINDVARGNIADIKFERDLSTATYKAFRDTISAMQSQLSALQSILRSQEEI